ncbi:MAG: FeoB-associated Cys-rich membrane protein [Bacteroidales bacterium]|nr:FeoB-associated Cys-rich membrane protein [Bacteroidales bacterium]
MIQEIVAIIIIVSAFIYAGIKIVKKVKDPLGKCKDCSSSSCESCELQSLKHQIDENKRKNKSVESSSSHL